MTLIRFGVDGCRGGWFYFKHSEDNFRPGFTKDFNDFGKNLSTDSLVLVDIPIGLPNVPDAARLCDRLARERLGLRRASIFPAPVREILDIPAYKTANQTSRLLTGKGLSLQTYHIIHKIRQVDLSLRQNPPYNHMIREAHPELCFLGLAKGRPLVYKKKSLAGYEERLEILKKYCPSAGTDILQAMDRYPRNLVARDDIVDALVLAISAVFTCDILQGIPEETILDSCGIPMQIVYPGW